jgi:caspase domain-containing protein
MNAYAVVIGVDEYKVQPLTSAVRDALKFRAALLELELVRETDVTLLTSPPQPDGRPADRRTIMSVMRELYDRGTRLDRLYFFFAGHGLTAWTDAAHSVVETALIPADVEDLIGDSNLLFNFDNLRARLEHAGPAEQFFFVDACRDLAFGERPANLPDLGWPASLNPSPAPTAQAAIYAVSPGGQAEGVRDGMGIFTSHLIDALHGRGRALEYSDELDAFVVTAESIRNLVQARVRATVADQPQWKRQIMLPDLRPSGPPLTPLRRVDNPPQPTLTLSFDPKGAAAYSRVELMSRGDPLFEPRWPPRRHGEAVILRPQVYRIRAESDRGVATPEPLRVDLREVSAATIRVYDHPPEAPPVLEAAPGEAQVESAGVVRTLGEQPVSAKVHVEAVEPGAMIELVGLDPPYRRWEAAVRLIEDVPPGSYSVRFRVGSEVYSQTEVDVAAGERTSVAPTTVHSPLIAEAVSQQAGEPVVVSETIGPMYTSTLLTVLPIVGVLPFDTTGELFGRFRPLVSELEIEAFKGRAVRVVVAVDGSAWPVPPSEVAAGVHCQLISTEGTVLEVPLQRLTDSEHGWGRIAHGTVPAPGRSFTMRVRSPWLGSIELAGASLPGRVTVMGFAVNPDGSLDTVQHLLRVPGRQYPEPDPDIPYGRFLRELILGQRLYESNELVERNAPPASEPQTQLLRDLLFAKWTDPVLGCMAYYAWNDAVRRGLPAAQGVASSNTEITARNLLTYFSDLPDARVIGALAQLPKAEGLAQALHPGEVPVLARSLREAARAGGSAAEPLQRWAAQVAPESPWTLVWQPEPAAAQPSPQAPAPAMS